MNYNPTFSGSGKRTAQFQTRAPVGKLGNRFKGIPRVGRSSSKPLFSNNVTPITQMKALTPAFRGPAKLPSNFMKNIPGLGQVQSKSARAKAFTKPLKGKKRKK